MAVAALTSVFIMSGYVATNFKHRKPNISLDKCPKCANGFSALASRTLAICMSYQRNGQEHLVKGLLDDERGTASGLIKAATLPFFFHEAIYATDAVAT